MTPSSPDEKIGVLTLVDGIGPGGGERLAVEIAIRLDPDRFDRTLCVSRDPGDDSPEYVRAAAERLRGAGVRMISLGRRTKMDVSAWRPLLTFLRRHRVDVLHSHKFGANVWAAVLGKLAKVPVIIAHEHTWSYEGMPARRFLDRELIARASSVMLAVSREDQRRMVEIERIRPEHVMFLSNGIPDLPPPTGRDVLSSLGIEPGAPVVGAVSVLRAQKRIDVLIRAAALLAPDFPGLRVLIAGAGEQTEYDALLRELGLTDTVRLLGLRTDLTDLLGIFQVAVSSSDWEGSPLSVMEYMAAARPIVATRVGGVPDLIDDGVEGLLVERRDPAALAGATAMLLRDPARAAEMGRRARDRQQREFTIEAMVERLEGLYEEELRRARGASSISRGPAVWPERLPNVRRR